MTQTQVEKLKKHKVKDKQMQGLSQLEAQKLIDSLERRRKLGFCSLNQLVTLQKYCNPPKSLPFKQASKALNYLSEVAKWRDTPEHRAELQRMVERR